jgi:exosortase
MMDSGGRAAARSPMPLPFAFLERVPRRVLALLGLVLLAYHYSLGTLARGLALQTPLADLALVPLIALALAWVRLRREPTTRPIHDRQVDYIVGFGLIAAAIGLIVLLPATLEMRFWLYRIDLLSLPFFVAGVVTLLWGVRRAWAAKVPILFLMLAWPLPYAPLVGDWTDGFTAATAAILRVISQVLPFATAAAGDGMSFTIGSGPTAFAVSVGSACAGVNSLVGFVLLGSALAYIVRGPTGRRLAWLGAGLAIIWALNVVRIEAIFVVGTLFGRAAALDVLHPVAGLIIFNLGVLGMLYAVSRFGLAFKLFDPPATEAIAAPDAVRRVSPALICAVAVAVVLAGLNAGLGRYEAIATPLGEAKRLEPFPIRNAQVAGWTSGYVAANPAGKQFFGQNSTWDRIQYAPSASAALQASVPVYVDVIGTDDPGSFAAYSVQACYSFHGYAIESTASVDVGAGVTAQVIDYRNTKIDADWSAISWEWPYQKNGRTWFERIVVFVASGPAARYSGLDGVRVASQSPRFAQTDQFLTTIATRMVASQIKVASR